MIIKTDNHSMERTVFVAFYVTRFPFWPDCIQAMPDKMPQMPAGVLRKRCRGGFGISDIAKVNGMSRGRAYKRLAKIRLSPSWLID